MHRLVRKVEEQRLLVIRRLVPDDLSRHDTRKKKIPKMDSGRHGWVGVFVGGRARARENETTGVAQLEPVNAQTSRQNTTQRPYECYTKSTSSRSLRHLLTNKAPPSLAAKFVQASRGKKKLKKVSVEITTNS